VSERKDHESRIIVGKRPEFFEFTCVGKLHSKRSTPYENIWYSFGDSNWQVTQDSVQLGVTRIQKAFLRLHNRLDLAGGEER
jgi:hypothetical protein